MSAEPEALRPYMEWACSERERLRALHAEVRTWPHVHTDLLPRFGRDHAEVPTFERHAVVIGPCLVSLAAALDRGEDGSGEVFVLVLACLALIAVPHFDIEIRRSKAEPANPRASGAASSLVRTLRSLVRARVMDVELPSLPEA